MVGWVMVGWVMVGHRNSYSDCNDLATSGICSVDVHLVHNTSEL